MKGYYDSFYLCTQVLTMLRVYMTTLCSTELAHEYMYDVVFGFQLTELYSSHFVAVHML